MKFLALLTACVILSGCGSSSSNVLPIVAGSCGPGSYQNEPCVSVTICSPGTNSCQTIDNVLLDTGSYGLRVFGSLLTVNLGQQPGPNGGEIAECVQYLGQNSDWGPVQIADVVLGSETASSVPIQVIAANFSQRPNACANADVNPQTAGFNGILGVGLLIQDCGAQCSGTQNNGIYFSCGNGGCTSVAVPQQNQVSNPVSFLSTDGNGFSIQFPTISANGQGTVNGSMTLGIGTQGNNTPSNVTVLTANSAGNFTTIFAGTTDTSSFIDSGTSALIFPQPNPPLNTCPSSGATAGLYCPNSPASLTAEQVGGSGAQAQVSFEVVSAQIAFSSNNQVFNDVAGSSTTGFIWGFPFFLGRTIYFGLETKSSSLAQGPYWAY